MKKIKYSEITPEKIYNNRRSFIKSIGFSASSIAITSLPFVNNALGKEQDQLTSYKDITTYNNYYEFGTSKGDPYKNSQNFKIKPWNISIEGEVEKPIKLMLLTSIPAHKAKHIARSPSVKPPKLYIPLMISLVWCERITSGGVA